MVALELDASGIHSLQESYMKEVQPLFYHYSNLERLSLSENSISEIPVEFCQTFASLLFLDLYRNRISTLPAEFSQLTLLQSLDLSENCISDAGSLFPVSSLRELEVLDLSSNAITCFPACITSLSNLEELYLGHNKIKDIPSSISSLQCLIVLDISYNEISALPPDLSLLRLSLRQVNLTGNKLVPSTLMSAPLDQVLLCLQEMYLQEVEKTTAPPAQQDTRSKVDAIPTITLEDRDQRKRLHRTFTLSPRDSKECDISSFLKLKQGLDVAGKGSLSAVEEGVSKTLKYNRELRLSKSKASNIKVAGEMNFFLAKQGQEPAAEKILIAEEDGYELELGRELFMSVYSRKNVVLEEYGCFPDYRMYFMDKPHVIFVGSSSETGTVVATIMKEASYNTAEGSMVSLRDTQCYRGLVRTKFGDERYFIPSDSVKMNRRSVWPRNNILLRNFLEIAPQYEVVKFRSLPANLELEVLKIESSLTWARYKFGVLYCHNGQVDENDMFNNTDPSPHFEDFLNFLGDRVKLQGFSSYAGGLDVRNSSTGAHSVWTTFHGYEIMFHVSTLLPYFPRDEQQVERKRHLGNDIVILIFNDTTSQRSQSSEPIPFCCSCIHSNFNHVFVVVTLEQQDESGTYYRIAVATKSGVLPSKPSLPSPAIFERSDPRFREFFLTKLINAERAAYSAPQFSRAIKRTRAEVLSNFEKESISIVEPSRDRGINRLLSRKAVSAS